MGRASADRGKRISVEDDDEGNREAWDHHHLPLLLLMTMVHLVLVVVFSNGLNLMFKGTGYTFICLNYIKVYSHLAT